MYIGERLRSIREAMKLSQGDIETRTGLLRCYISRVENGHTVPSLETLEKLANALEVPLYQLFYDGEDPPRPRPGFKKISNATWGERGKDAHQLTKLRDHLSRMSQDDLTVLMAVALHIANQRSRKSTRPKKITG